MLCFVCNFGKIFECILNFYDEIFVGEILLFLWLKKEDEEYFENLRSDKLLIRWCENCN